MSGPKNSSELRKLGTMPDPILAEKWGVSKAWVQQLRKQRGIPSFRARTRTSVGGGKPFTVVATIDGEVVAKVSGKIKCSVVGGALRPAGSVVVRKGGRIKAQEANALLSGLLKHVQERRKAEKEKA